VDQLAYAVRRSEHIEQVEAILVKRGGQVAFHELDFLRVSQRPAEAGMQVVTNKGDSLRLATPLASRAPGGNGDAVAQVLRQA
jgi:hypothetical protein